MTCELVSLLDFTLVVADKEIKLDFVAWQNDQFKSVNYEKFISEPAYKTYTRLTCEPHVHVNYKETENILNRMSGKVEAITRRIE